MFKFLVGLLFVPVMANAQPVVVNGSMDVICSTTENVMKEILKYEEIKLWSAIESSTIVVSLWQNLETKTFTIIKTDIIREVSCVISMGIPPKKS